MKYKRYLNLYEYSHCLIIFIIVTNIVISFITKDILNIIALIITLIISSITTSLGIKQLKQIKLNQIIRKEGPENHKEKSGTPTMGGLMVIPIGIIIGNIININSSVSNQIVAISLLSLGFMLIGTIDDCISIKSNKNTGLTPKGKIILQISVSMIFIGYCNINQWIQQDILLPFNHSLNPGALLIPLSLFVILAESNATNLTDGLDGLASGCFGIVSTGLALELILRGGSDNIAISNFCISLCGSWLGFLLYNKNPAKIFMGDTGSLAMGASLAGVALLSNTLWALFVMGGIFLVESVSVILQVLFFKISKGKRIFLMAPLHHHYELKGNSEIEVVKSFWIISILLVIIGLIFRTNS